SRRVNMISVFVPSPDLSRCRKRRKPAPWGRLPGRSPVDRRASALGLLPTDAQDAVQLVLVDAAASDVVEGLGRGLDDVPGDDGCAFGGTLLGRLQAAFPLEDGPGGVAVLGQLREDGGEVGLAVTERTEAAR